MQRMVVPGKIRKDRESKGQECRTRHKGRKVTLTIGAKAKGDLCTEKSVVYTAGGRG